MTDPTRLILVVARADNGVIGIDGALPWHIPADLKRFKRLTMGRPILMGRKTFASIGRPLPGRRNIVLTRDTDWRTDGVEVAHSLDDALAMAGGGDVMLIGGGDLYAQAVLRAARVELTEVHAQPAGDAWFPELDPALWQEVEREDVAAEGDMPGYSFVSYARTVDAPCVG